MTRKLYVLLLTLIIGSQMARAEFSPAFASPDSFDARPWCFWYWMHGAVTREGITNDLEAMARNGLGGTYLMPIKSIEQKPELGGTVNQLSPEWYQMVDWAMQEADRLGLKLGMHICDGFALAGGPWITPEESMQKVVMTPINDKTGTTLGYYSIPSRYLHGEKLFEPVPSTKPSTENGLDVKVTGHGTDLAIDTLGGGFSAKKPCQVEYRFSRSITASALELVLPATQFQGQRLDVWASPDGVSFHHVKQLVPARTGWQNYDFNTTHAIPRTTAKIWRFTWDPEGTEPGSEDLDQAKWSPSLKVKQILFHAAPRINQWEGKAGLVWRISSTADNCLASEDYIPHQTIHELSSPHNIDRSQGGLQYFRLASVSTGHDNATGGGGKGLECDKFSRPAIRKQLNGWFNSHFYAPVAGRDSLEHLQLARRVLKYMHVDSWECGSQNWSPTFAREFKRLRGYDLHPYLPLLVGFPLDNEEAAERVLRDVRLTINQLIDEVFYDELRKNAREMDCQFSAESVCPTMISDGMQHYQYADLPMGEFWLNSPTHDKVNDMLDAISGAHIYGKPIIQAEGFTELRGVFDEDPAMLKPLMDRNFCLGINRLFYHVYCLNPDPKKRPGMTLDGIGLFFQEGNTWFEESSYFTQYITRCQYLLQQGRPVVDVAVYTGQEMPRRAFQPDRLVPMLPGLFGPERVAAEQARWANKGVPVATRPVGVKYGANLLVPEDWINPMHGYQYDSFNEDALLHSEVCRESKTLPVAAPRSFATTFVGGTAATPQYKLLVIPSAHKMDPDALPLSAAAADRIAQLKQQGVKVLNAQQPWTEADFKSLGIERDVNYLPDGVAYCHRSCPEAEIYFLSNQTDQQLAINPAFRDHKGRKAELWNALDGSIRLMGEKIVLPAYGSVFVVFPAVATDAERLSAGFIREAEPLGLGTLEGQQWTLRFHDIDTTFVSDTLPDWSKNEDLKVRYYSGRVTYTTTFESTALQVLSQQRASRIYLRLGRIANLATVRLNGKECGLAWTAPYEVDITDALQEGENQLEITVVNTWANAIQGNDEGHAPFDNIWTNARYRKSSPELLPAGLFGPVQIVGK